MSIGQVNVKLGLDAAEYVQGLTKAQLQARKFGEEVGSTIRSGAIIATSAFTAMSAAGVAAFAFIKEQTNAVDAFNDLSDATGASVESISALDRIARETGGSFATAEAVLVKFNMALASAKPDNDAGRLLKAMNLDIEKLKGLDPAEALRQTAVAFNGFTNDGNKARAMQELFGKSIKEAAPFLKDLADQTALVGTTSAATAQQAETFNKQLFALTANAQDAARSFVSDLLPAMNRFLQNYTELKKQGNLGLIVKDAAKDVFGLGKLTGDNGADINKFLRERERLEKNISFATRKGFPVDAYKKELDELQRYLEVARAKQLNEVTAVFGGDAEDALSRRFNKSMTLPDFAKTPKAGRGGAARSSGAEKDPTAEAQRYIESLQKQLERTQELTVQEQVLRDLQLDRFGQVTSAQKEQLLNVAGQIDAAKEYILQKDREAEAIAKADRAQQDMLDEGKRLFEEVRTPAELFADQQDRINTLLQAGAIDFVTAARAGEKYKKSFDESTKTMSELDKFTERATQNIQDTLGSGLAEIMDGNYKNIGDGFTKMLNRMAAEAIAADLAKRMFGGLVKGGEGEGWLGGLLKDFGSNLQGTGGSGGGAGGLFSSIGGFFSGLFGKAGGGIVAAGSMHRVNENGPEMLDYQGKQFLMMGNSGGTITPNSGRGAGVNQSVVFNLQGSVDSRTQEQIASTVYRATQRATARGTA